MSFTGVSRENIFIDRVREGAEWELIGGASAALEVAPPLQVALGRQLQLSAKLRRRLAEDLLEDAIEVCERLEPHFVGDFADAQVWVQQQAFGLFDAHTRNVVGEVHTGYLLEHL